MLLSLYNNVKSVNEFNFTIIILQIICKRNYFKYKKTDFCANKMIFFALVGAYVRVKLRQKNKK